MIKRWNDSYVVLHNTLFSVKNVVPVLNFCPFFSTQVLLYGVYTVQHGGGFWGWIPCESRHISAFGRLECPSLQCCGSGYVFRSFVDPYPYSEYRLGYKHVNFFIVNIG